MKTLHRKDIEESLRKNGSIQVAAKEFGVSSATISRIKARSPERYAGDVIRVRSRRHKVDWDAPAATPKPTSLATADVRVACALLHDAITSCGSIQSIQVDADGEVTISHFNEQSFMVGQ